MYKFTAFSAILSALFSTSLIAESPPLPMHFEPITGSSYAPVSDPLILNSEPWIIPKGFTQRIVTDETALNIYEGNDWGDMNTVNETGKDAGRYLYRAHEVRPGNDKRRGGGRGGSLSVVDLTTGKAKVLLQRADWEALDGIVWTPWHTLLFAEESIATTYEDPDVPQAVSGLLYEVTLDKTDPSVAERVTVRSLLGSLAHEGIKTDDEGNVYVVDEGKSGSIYKFVPEHYGDLSTGQLFALKVDAGAKTGAATWVALDMKQVQISARVAAKAVKATAYCRPEDLERIGKTLYAALTCEDASNAANLEGAGAILSISLGSAPHVKYFVAHGVNVVHENKRDGVTGFRNPDNLASGPDGKLWIVEDNVPSDIWVADPDDNDDGYSDGVKLFASLKDGAAEGTGLYFGKAVHTVFVNVQHSGTGNDKTVAISQGK